jgi:HEAT repeat protein
MRREIVMTHRRNLTMTAIFAAALALPAAAFDDVIDSPMYKLPEVVQVRVVRMLPPGTKELWLRCLDRPDLELRCKAAEAIALAHRRGLADLKDTAPRLLAALEQPDQDATVRLTIARALVALDARHAAPSLFRHGQAGSSDLRHLVEPALARWDYQPAREVWLARLSDPATPPLQLLLAIRCLASVGEDQAVKRLRELVLADEVPGPTRVEAARALGVIRTSGLEDDADSLTPPGIAKPVAERLAAAALLRHHKSPAAIEALRRLGQDAEPSVAEPAIARLIELDPSVVVPVVEGLRQSPDANLRLHAAQTLFRRPTTKHVTWLADLLDDPDPAVHMRARGHLLTLGREPQWKDAVLGEGTRMLAIKSWRGLEQAAILLAELDHKPAAHRLVELLSFARAEVYITAAWGLRRLAVAETLPAVVAHVEREFAGIMKDAPRGGMEQMPLVDHQLSQLNQFLGMQRHQPADALLRRFIPKDKGIPEGRASAIWALGMIHEGKPNPALARLFEQRINDAGLPSEFGQVRWMSAISLGRLKAKEALATLRMYYTGPSLNAMDNACGWAIEQITGEKLPTPPESLVHYAQDRSWFLVPSAEQERK